MQNVIHSPLFGIFITVAYYYLFTYLKQYIKFSLFNPFLLTTISIITTLLVFNISYDDYFNGASIYHVLLTPATSILALSIYHQRKLLKHYWIPILLGCISGTFTSVFSVIFLAKLFKLEKVLEISLIPKSITTAIAVDVSTSLNGIISITILAVIISGLIGMVFAPILIKLFRFKNPIIQGCAIGCSSHALGTSTAIQLGEIQAAISSIAIIITGITTVLLALFLK